MKNLSIESQDNTLTFITDDADLIALFETILVDGGLNVTMSGSTGPLVASKVDNSYVFTF